MNETTRLTDAYIEKWGDDARYGPAHIVCDDGNMGDSSLRFCLADCDKREAAGECSPELAAATREYLNALLAIPEDDREYLCPEDEE